MNTVKMAAPITNFTRKYLIHFAHEHTDFRIAELSSILNLFSIKAAIPSQQCISSPFLTLELPSEDCVRKIASRSVLIKSVFQLWAHGNTYEELNNSLRQLPKSFLEPYVKSTDTFKYQVTSFNKTVSSKEKVEKIESLATDVLTFEGKVNLKNAQHVYYILEYYGEHGSTSADQPLDIYFGKWITDGQRDKINEFHLQKRHFIANTSMDAGLSMIMANIGQVHRNMLVFDPFVGSGSLLVSAAAHGAYVMGTDIDYLLLHAKARPSRSKQKKRAEDESIRSNLLQYGLDHLYIDALVADSSRSNMWRQQTLFDAIITDPPYGIREGAKKVGSQKADVKIDEEVKASGKHISQKKEYHLSDIFKDLLNFSAKYLHKHGRLVYWFPVSRDTYREENIPTHPCLEMVHNCEQRLNTKVARRLITMEKIHDVTEDTSEAVMAVDHFEEATFRDMYFSENTKAKEWATKSVDNTAGDSAKITGKSVDSTAGDSAKIKGKSVDCTAGDSAKLNSSDKSQPECDNLNCVNKTKADINSGNMSQNSCEGKTENMHTDTTENLNINDR